MRNINALNETVFIERDPDNRELNGFIVGDKAVVKAVTGTVFESASHFVASGDVIHLPHQKAKILDCMVDGRELAAIKGGDLFAVKKDGAFRPINRNLLVRKCVNDHVRDKDGNVDLYMTENHIEFTNWVEIIDVSDDCEWVSKKYVGWFCLAPESDDNLQRIERSKDYCIREELVQFITDGE